jgi:subtilisin-like proprotein convertase family protein
MKTRIVQATRLAALAGLISWSHPASAALFYSYSGSPVVIPDNAPSGTGFAFSLTDPATSITDVSVTLDISGGYNGDLYAYISHGSAVAVLLNRVGVGSSSTYGYGDSGFLITLSSSAAANVHSYQNSPTLFNGNGQLTGDWRPDGRLIDPASSPSAFDSAPTSANFGSFTGQNPNGDWTLFFEDMSPGGVSTLTGFSVNLSVVPVPEPVNVALGIFGGILAGLGLWRAYRASGSLAVLTIDTPNSSVSPCPCRAHRAS